MNHHFIRAAEIDDDLGRQIHFQKFGMVFPVENDPVAESLLRTWASILGQPNAFTETMSLNEKRVRVADLMEKPRSAEEFCRIFQAVVPVIEEALDHRENLDDPRHDYNVGRYEPALRLTPNN